MEIAPPRAPGRVYAGNSASGNARVQYGDIHGNVTYNVYEVRQERIGIEASISGLRSLTVSIRDQLLDLEFEANDDDHLELFGALGYEVATSMFTLDAFVNNLSWLHASPEQAALVRLDRLVILLANAIVLFDKFRSSLNGQPAAGFDGSSSFLPQLREHNMAWKLQLEIMERHTMDEIDAISSDLDSATSMLLRENADLKKRMNDFQVQLDQVSQQLINSGASMQPGTIHSIKDQRFDFDFGFDTDSDTSPVQSAASYLEDTLNSTWVYRRNRYRSEVMSCNTSLLRDYAWSEMSELTLANKSALSVLALPIDLSELAHRSWYQSHAQPSELTMSEEIDLVALVKRGKLHWDQLSDDQISNITNQLVQREGFRNIPGQPSQLSMKKIDDTARTLGLLGDRAVLERCATKILGDQDFRSFKQGWEKYDPSSTMYISKEAFQRLIGDLPESFGFRIYLQEFTVARTLSKAWSYSILTRDKRRDIEYDLTEEASWTQDSLNTYMTKLPIEEVRYRRKRMQRMYTEVMITADPDGRIAFMSLLAICAMWRDENQFFRRVTLASYLGHRTRMIRVEEVIRRETVVGFYDMLHWSRKFRRYQALKKSGYTCFRTS